VVLFKKERLAFAGDLITFGRDPLIHVAKGGSAFGLVKNLKSLLELEADIFVPGHNEPCGKKEIEGLIKAVEEKMAKVGELVKQGRNLGQVKEILKVVERVLPNGRRFPAFEEAAYRDISGKES
jgi:cyclase